MIQKTKKATHSTRQSSAKTSSAKELPAISWTGYSSKGEATKRRIEKVHEALAAARKELTLK